jgi:anti-sigma regulatory factor (Ser/Thr protein kinase)
MLEHEFNADTLHILREAVLAHAVAVGMSEGRATEVMLVAHELASNAIRHGGGTGRLRIRIAAGVLHCQVTDPGIARSNGPAASAGQRRASGTTQLEPWPYQPGHGLWLVRQAADHFTAVTGPHGSQVTVSFALPSAILGKRGQVLIRAGRGSYWASGWPWRPVA